MGYWIVVVDDEPLCLTNARAMLGKTDMRVSCLRSGENLLRFMENNSPDLILLDIMMPDMDGFETFRALRQYEEKSGKTRTPVIFLTGEENSEIERRGLKAGASDFIHKPFDEGILIKRIKNTIINSKTIESLTQEATLDKLTGFLNKVSGTGKISGMVGSTDGTLMIMDLDNFKLVNDLYGHDMGDRILIAFAEVVRSCIRSDDVVCRAGGDEFMAFFPTLTGRNEVKALADRLNSRLAEEAEALMGKDHGVPLGISVGAAAADADTRDFQTLFQYADSALYEVKRNGKHGLVVYDPEPGQKPDRDDPDTELLRVTQIMTERGMVDVALLLGQDTFSCNYRYIERLMSQLGGSLTRLLISISFNEKDEKGESFPQTFSRSFSEVVSAFEKILMSSLSRTDIILRWQQNRYFAVLPYHTQEDLPGIKERIAKGCESAGISDKIRVSYSYTTVSFEKKGASV